MRIGLEKYKFALPMYFWCKWNANT